MTGRIASAETQACDHRGGLRGTDSRRLEISTS